MSFLPWDIMMINKCLTYSQCQLFLEKTTVRDKYYTNQEIVRNLDEKKEATPGNDSRHWDYVQPEEPVKREVWPDTVVSDKGTTGVPAQLKELLRMLQQEPWLLTRNKSFWEQALLMVDYEDDVHIVPFFAYFPVYRSMDISQLRSYFSFRKQVRNGEYPEVSLSYLFVYIYEILMQIGIENPGQGLDILERIKNAYSVSQPKLMGYLDTWIRDYIVYYDLADRVKDHFADKIQEDILAQNLKDYKDVTDELLFETVASLSSYKIKSAALFKKHPQEVITVTARVIRSVVPIYELRYGYSIDELCFGLRKQIPYSMFESAIFYSPSPVKEGFFGISSRRAYECKGGLWCINTYNGNFFSGKGSLLGQILHETDRRLRVGLSLKSPMSRKMFDKDVEPVIQEVIDSFLKEKEEASRPVITVDFSKLDKIRLDADIIRDALLREEEPLPETSLPANAAVEEKTEKEDDPQEGCDSRFSEEGRDSVFTAEERDFLRLLLQEGDWKNYLRGIHIPVGVMTDNINEKVMEDLNDILIVDEGDGPTVLDDYKEYITGMV